MFRYPWLLLLLIPVVLWLVMRLRKPGTMTLPSLKTWAEGENTWRVRLWWVPEVLWGCLLGTGVFLLAGPLKPADPQETHSRGLNLAVVLDRSGSMGVRLDPEKTETRFEAVKTVLGQFLSRRQGDGVTLISFARFPETHTPLTRSLDIIQGFLELIPLAVEESEAGTAVGDALMLAAARLSQGGAGEAVPGVVLLLTDGRNNAGTTTPVEGARVLAGKGLRLYTIGLGGKGYFVQDSPFGASLIGQTVDLDIPGLRSIAQLTGGEYFQADSPQDLDALLKKLEEGALAELTEYEMPPRTLDLTPGLWILLLLLACAPGARWFVLRRDWK